MVAPLIWWAMLLSYWICYVSYGLWNSMAVDTKPFVWHKIRIYVETGIFFSQYKLKWTFWASFSYKRCATDGLAVITNIIRKVTIARLRNCEFQLKIVTVVVRPNSNWKLLNLSKVMVKKCDCSELGMGLFNENSVYAQQLWRPADSK